MRKVLGGISPYLPGNQKENEFDVVSIAYQELNDGAVVCWGLGFGVAEESTLKLIKIKSIISTGVSPRKFSTEINTVFVNGENWMSFGINLNEFW